MLYLPLPTYLFTVPESFNTKRLWCKGIKVMVLHQGEPLLVQLAPQIGTGIPTPIPHQHLPTTHSHFPLSPIHSPLHLRAYTIMFAHAAATHDTATASRSMTPLRLPASAQAP